MRQFEFTACIDQDSELTSFGKMTAGGPFFIDSSRSYRAHPTRGERPRGRGGCPAPVRPSRLNQQLPRLAKQGKTSGRRRTEDARCGGILTRCRSYPCRGTSAPRNGSGARAPGLLPCSHALTGLSFGARSGVASRRDVGAAVNDGGPENTRSVVHADVYPTRVPRYRFNDT